MHAIKSKSTKLLTDTHQKLFCGDSCSSAAPAGCYSFLCCPQTLVAKCNHGKIFNCSDASTSRSIQIPSSNVINVLLGDTMQ